MQNQWKPAYIEQKTDDFVYNYSFFGFFPAARYFTMFGWENFFSFYKNMFKHTCLVSSLVIQGW